MSNDNAIKGGEFSISKMKEILKSNTDKRVSKDAARELRNLLENTVEELAEDSISEAESDGRKTVRDSDVVSALRNRGDL